MVNVDVVADRLGLDGIGAQEVVDKATEYWNRGKGLVFIDYKTADKVAELFDQKPIWLSAELNERVGWQFSQAIFQLRRWGYKIKTVCLGNRMFAYKLIEKPDQE